MDYDFRFKNSEGKWKSAGHKKGATRAAAFKSLAESADGDLPSGQYMSRPRGRQKDWDLFTFDPQVGIATLSDADAEPDTARSATEWRR